MRQIKFRGKTEIGNRWVVGAYSQRNHTITWDEGNHNEFYVIQDTVGQYTGLKDKAGRDIYEGDIVRSDKSPFSTHREKDNLYAVVEWLEYCTMFALSFYFNPNGGKRGDWGGTKHILGYFEELEVIGNIHDNPELLNN